MARKEKPITEDLIVYDMSNGEKLAEYPAELINTIKNTVAKNATDEELQLFMQTARMYNLNPFLKEIWFVKNKDGSCMTMTSRDGYLKIAKQNPDFKKCQSMAVYENDEFNMELNMGEILNIHHKFSQNDRGKIIGAYAIIKTHSNDNIVCYSDFKEYNKNNNVWRKYPTAMIRKVAENDVLKRFAGIDGLQSFEDAPSSEQKLAEEIIDIEL